MVKEKLEKFYFSQSALEAFAQCRLKFKKRYLDGLYWSRKELLPPEQLEALEKGIAFHLLAQRYFSGLATGVEQVRGGELELWLRRLENLVPLNPEINFWPEYQLKVNSYSGKLVAKYDLLCFEPQGKIIIYDWKTDQRPLVKEKLAKSWQTIIYPYLIIEAGVRLMGSPVSPEQVKMVYWNPLYPEKLVEFPYSEQAYQQDKAVIERTIKEICSLAETSFFPTNQSQLCRYCEYSYLCQKATKDYNYLLGEESLDQEFCWKEIEEYPY